MQAIAELKALVLEMLEGAFQEGQTQLTQQMGVNLTNAVRREGVVIIQNQNVEVYARIMPSMVKMLKLCDALESNCRRQAAVEIEALPEPLPAPGEDDADVIDACCAWLYENHFNWQDMQELMKARYLEYVISRFRTKAEAAKWLGVGSTYLSKLSRISMNN